MIFDQPPRQCSGCSHWNINYAEGGKGYLEARCQQPKDDRDRLLKRASDYCSKWSRRAATSGADQVTWAYFG
jgi:hypothetical protein